MTEQINITSHRRFNALKAGNFTCRPGKVFPLGATPIKQGVQFSIFSHHASKVWLELYENEEAEEALLEICLSPKANKTGDYWHITVEGLAVGQCYLYRMDGVFHPESGMRFNPHQRLIDPYARALGGIAWKTRADRIHESSNQNGDQTFPGQNDTNITPRCIIVDNDFDWQGDTPLNYPLADSIIYESHVRGLTCHRTAAEYGVKHPGSFQGVIEIIPYLKKLGITSLELLPVQEFDELEYSYRHNPIHGLPLKNYWGYSSIAFFAPKTSYGLGSPVKEFKEMVRQLHLAGIELILDIVFNHSGEGNETGPTYSFRGIDNKVYYILDTNPFFYMNFSGCGNTMNCNHSVMKALIIDALHYWVQEAHVDGFRFDLASILGRDEHGSFIEGQSLLDDIAGDLILKNTKIIAEPWDASDGYRLGRFPGRWAEWNDHYRDSIKMFWRGDSYKTATFASIIRGSANIFQKKWCNDTCSINYITAHDGFTLNDLVSYNDKHNEPNGEENKDGSNHNFSFNLGFEGPTNDPYIETLRKRMVKNFLATLFLSIGTPMILGGDEMRRTQHGNNNAYCQDNEISWYNYELVKKHADIHRFLRCMIRFRKKQKTLHSRNSLSHDSVSITWYNELGREANWERAENLLSMHVSESGSELLVLFNAESKDYNFLLPQSKSGKKWLRIVDTFLPSPEDFVELGDTLETSQYLLRERTLAVFTSS